MGRTYDITISEFDLDRLEADLLAAERAAAEQTRRANENHAWALRAERERDEARNAMAQAQGELDLKTLDFERMREQRDQLLKQLAAMESAGAEQARRADENREWSLKVERERDAERALAEQRGRLYDTAIGQLKKLQAQVDELNDKIRYNEVESSHNWRNRERDREAISAWKEARND